MKYCVKVGEEESIWEVSDKNVDKPYEIRCYGTNQYVTVYNKETDEYIDDFGKRVVIEYDNEIKFDGDATEFISEGFWVPECPEGTKFLGLSYILRKYI